MDLAYPLAKPLDLARLCERICALNPRLRAIRAMRAPQPRSALHVLVKDNIGLAGFSTPAGSFALRDLKLPDAFCVKQIKRAGIDVFGKTHMTELAGFVTTANPTRGYSHLGGFGVNPHGEEFPCGGSSSGSAIAVAAGLCDAALGTETRGSLMQPGLFCGVYAFKPTVGLISRSGIVPLAESFDTPGVLARDLRTLRELLEVLRGTDPEDRVTELSGEISLQVSPLGKNPIRIGMLRFGDTVDSEVLAALEHLAPQAKDFEFSFVDASPMAFDYKQITSAQIMRGMDRFLGRYATGNTPRSFRELAHVYETHPDVRPFGMDRIADALSMPPMEQRELDRLAQHNIQRAREAIDLILRQGPYDALLGFAFTDWWAIAGAPSLTLPLGTSPQGRPLGIMLGAAHKEDGKLIAIGERLAALLSQSSRG